MFRHDITKTVDWASTRITYLPTYLPAYLPTFLPTYLPTCLPTTLFVIETKVPETAGIVVVVIMIDRYVVVSVARVLYDCQSVLCLYALKALGASYRIRRFTKFPLIVVGR